MGVIRASPAIGLAFAVFVWSRPLFCRCLHPWSRVLPGGTPQARRRRRRTWRPARADTWSHHPVQALDCVAPV